MERNIEDVLCFIVVFFVGLVFVLDLLGVVWAMLRKKPYKSMIGGFIESFLDYPALFWMPVIIAILYVYYFMVTNPY